MGWERGDQQRREEENMSLSRIMTSPFQGITCMLVIYDISVRGRYSEGCNISRTTWKYTSTKRSSASVPNVPHYQGSYILLLIHVYSTSSVSSTQLMTTISGVNEWGEGGTSKMRIYYLPYLFLCLKLY